MLMEPDDEPTHYLACVEANEQALIEEDGTEVCICTDIQQALEDEHADRMFRERREELYDRRRI